jgi:hypothetical protein
MLNLKQAYQQLNRYEATFQILRTKSPKKVFQYEVLDVYAAK